MNETDIVDSSGWLEYLADSKSAAFFSPAIEDAERLLVPVFTIYEVFKKSAARARRKRSAPSGEPDAERVGD